MIVVIVQTRDPHRQAEAMRAALGLTLRGSRVQVIVDAALSTPLAQRAADTLISFGHSVGPGDIAAAIRAAHAVEVWT